MASFHSTMRLFDRDIDTGLDGSDYYCIAVAMFASAHGEDLRHELLSNGHILVISIEPFYEH